MVEAWGRGMPLILKNAPDVVFRETGNLSIVSFNRPLLQHSRLVILENVIQKMPGTLLTKIIFHRTMEFATD